ncbi:MAG TPA: acyl-CoA dehydrogenase family protein [Slackia equolifaciens]|uniref:Acyl-CoA dehydrogenase family protein n=1 Tax=Slackia equolifaciens TaxID=498718 RepID=A0A9D2UY08_9ACTN|nr:acyl-CoA dehydrogenase family protein [Slackia equolifaciens]
MSLLSAERAIAPLVEDFAARHFDEDAIKHWVLSRGIPRYVYEDFYEGELGGFLMPAEAGGNECSFLERASLIAQITRRAAATLPFLSDMLTYALISTMRSLSRHELVDYMKANSGRILLSEAFTEDNAGSDANAVATAVTIDGDHLYLDGCKTFVSNGQFAPSMLVLARDSVLGMEDGGISLWVVPVDAEGVSTFPINSVGQEMLAPARISFRHVLLDPEWRIQTEGRLNIMLKRQYELGRILICASSLGLARAAMDDALAYSSSHMTKGRCLASLPQIQTKLTEMEVRLRSMDLLVESAAALVDGGESDEFHLNCALMKYFVPKAATEVASEALQIFGNRGYTDQTRVGRIWKDCRGNQIAQGADEVMVHAATRFLVKGAEA